jgi:hypothetical protein
MIAYFNHCLSSLGPKGIVTVVGVVGLVRAFPVRNLPVMGILLILVLAFRDIAAQILIYPAVDAEYIAAVNISRVAVNQPDVSLRSVAAGTMPPRLRRSSLLSPQIGNKNAALKRGGKMIANY